MKTRTHNRKAAVVLSLAAALLAIVGVMFHGCGVAEYDEQFGDVTLSRIVLTPANPSIFSGQTVTFTAEGVFADSHREDLTSSVTWQSSYPDVVVIDKGIATVGEVGSENLQCIVTVTGPDGITAMTMLTVKAMTAEMFESIVISAPSATIPLEASVQFSAVGTMSDGSIKDLSSKMTWTSSKPAVVDIDAAGKATALSGGSADITAAWGTETFNTVTVTVSTAILDTIAVELVNGGNSISQGAEAQLKAVGTYNDGSILDITDATWNSSAPAIVAVSVSGMATGVSPGSADITATKGTVTSSVFTVTITEAAQVVLTSITISSNKTSIAVDGFAYFTATGTFSDDHSEDLTATVAWQSSTSATEIGTLIAGKMAVKGKTVGSATITATKSSVTSNSVPLDVTPAIGY